MGFRWWRATRAGYKKRSAAGGPRVFGPRKKTVRKALVYRHSDAQAAGRLFADGSEEKYFAVASNEWEWEAKSLLEWHREKAGSIEAVHDVVKNELACGVMPCARFGANAAWLRLALLTHNLLTALKRIGRPEPWLRARPKRLRFQIFCSPQRRGEHDRVQCLGQRAKITACLRARLSSGAMAGPSRDL